MGKRTVMSKKPLKGKGLTPTFEQISFSKTKTNQFAMEPVFQCYYLLLKNTHTFITPAKLKMAEDITKMKNV